MDIPDKFPFTVRFVGKSRPGYFINGKMYQVIGQHIWSESLTNYRIIDESGEDYLYSLEENFEILDGDKGDQSNQISV